MFKWKCSKCGFEHICAVDEFKEEYKDREDLLCYACASREMGKLIKALSEEEARQEALNRKHHLTVTAILKNINGLFSSQFHEC